MLRAVKKNVGELPVVVEIDNDLKTLQDAVDGYIELYPFADDILIILNEEGKLRGLPVNFVCGYGGYYETIVGNVLFVADGEEDIESLTDEQVARVMRKFEHAVYK